MWYSYLIKWSPLYKLGATGWNPLFPNLHVLDAYSISFIFAFKEHLNCVFKASRKSNSIPASSVVVHTRIFIKNNKSQSNWRPWKEAHCNVNKKIRILALIFRNLPCPQKFLATRLQYNRISSEVYVGFFRWFKFIWQMFKEIIKNISSKGILRQILLPILSYFPF